MWPNLQFPADIVKFTEEIFNGKLHFLSNDATEMLPWNIFVKGMLNNFK